jgi:hypothetical protein
VFAAIVIAAPSPAEAQWSIERSSGDPVARTLGLEGRIQVMVSCQGSSQIVTLKAPAGAALNGESVEAQWDDGTTERYRLLEELGTLRASSTSPEIERLLRKLRQRRTVRILAMNALDEEVTDRFSLTGSSRALGALPCGSSASGSDVRHSGPTDAEIRRILVRQSISRYSGSCPCPTTLTGQADAAGAEVLTADLVELRHFVTRETSVPARLRRTGREQGGRPT